MGDYVNLREILLSDDIIESLESNLDIILDYIPEVRFMIGFDQKHPDHHLDVWRHTLYALSMSEKDFDIRLVLLLHDIGKPFSYQDVKYGDKVIRHFTGHAMISSKIAYIILNRLGYEEEYVNYICYLIKMHDTPIRQNLIDDNIDLAKKLYKIQYCDAMAHHPSKLKPRIDYLNKTKILLNV